MEILIAIIISVGTGLATGVAVMVVAEKGQRLSQWLIRRGAALYPAPRCERMKEEWLAHLATLDGPYSMLWHGLGCFITGFRRGETIRRSVDYLLGYTIIAGIGSVEWALNVETPIRKNIARIPSKSLRFLTGFVFGAVYVPVLVFTIFIGFASTALSGATSMEHPNIDNARSAKVDINESLIGTLRWLNEHRKSITRSVSSATTSVRSSIRWTSREGS